MSFAGAGCAESAVLNMRQNLALTNQFFQKKDIPPVQGDFLFWPCLLLKTWYAFGYCLDQKSLLGQV